MKSSLKSLSSFFMLLFLSNTSVSAQTTISSTGTYTQGALDIVVTSIRDKNHTMDFYPGNGSVGSMNTTDISGLSIQQRWDMIWRLNSPMQSYQNHHSNTMNFVFDFNDFGVTVAPGTVGNYYLVYRVAGSSGNWLNAGGTKSKTSSTVTFTGISIGEGNDFEFSFATSDTVNSPLPVKLLYFNAVSNDDYVELNWATASEVNNSHFEIQKYVKNSFVNVGQVNGVGNSSQIVKYNFTDMDINQDYLAYYRLKQVDYDGNYQYSNVIFESNSKTKYTMYFDTIGNRLDSPPQYGSYLEVILEKTTGLVRKNIVLR